MRTALWKKAVLAAGLVWFGIATSMAAGAADTATVREGTAKWFKAYNAGDADAIVALYTDDAVIMPPGAPPARGPAAIKAFLVKDIADARAGGVVIVMGDKDEVDVKGDVAWHAGTYAVMKAGSTIDTGAYVEISRKTGGKWHIIRDIWNSSTPTDPPNK